jgi:calpain-15
MNDKYIFQNRINFVDDQFPPAARSIGNENKSVSRWLRIGDVVCREKKKKTAWMIMLNPQPNDIEQGHLGDCWLMAALALITERPRMLSHILLTPTVNKEGIYLLRICHNGLWKIVLLDDCFPCTDRDHLAFTQVRSATW